MMLEAEPLLDIPLSPHDGAAEMAYRRGFTQGVAAAIEAVKDGHELSALQRWLQRLMKWRYRRPCNRVVFPEWLSISQRSNTHEQKD